MKWNDWTLGLAALGVISLPGVARGDEVAHAVQTALASTTISGYVSTSAIWRFGHGNISPGRSFDGADKQDGFNLDVVKLQIEKPLDEGNWSAGYQVGLLFGPDANTYDTTSTFSSDSDFGIKDATINLRAPLGNGLDFKVGFWESPVGYELFDAGSNPNYSRSYGYYIEPHQFTGVLASYKVSEVLSLAGGIADRGWDLAPGLGNTVIYDRGDNVNARSGGESTFTYLGSVALRAPASAGFLEGATLFGGVVDSGIVDGPDAVNWYVGGMMPTPVEGLRFGAAYDYRSNSSEATYSSAHAWAVSGYLVFQLSEKLRLNGRAEYATGSNGTWYLRAFDDEENELLGITGTLDYTLWANTITRLEFRWDQVLSGAGIFNDGTDDNALSLALNVIYRY